MTTSVIIPAFNAGEFIGESIGSVLGQTCQDFEIIVVDDGSTDDTERIVNSFRDGRIRYRRTGNRGVSAARNLGLDMATGEFVAFLDADDRWNHAKLERQLALAQRTQLGMVFSDFRRFDKSGWFPKTLFSYVHEFESRKESWRVSDHEFVITDDTFCALVGLDMFATWVQTVLLKRAEVLDLRFPVGVRLGEDLHYMLAVYQRVRAGFIDVPLVDVRRHESNSYRASEEMLMPTIRALQSVRPLLVDKAHRKALDERLGRAWIGFGYHNFWNGSALNAMVGYAKGLRVPGARSNALGHLLLTPFCRALRLARRDPRG